MMAIAMLVSIPLDLVLVPWTQQTFGNGAIGGALAFVVTEFGMLVLGIYLLPKGSLGWSNVWVSARIFLAGIIMAIVVWQFRGSFIVIPILLGIFTFVGLSFLFGVLPTEYLSLFQDVGKNLLVKFRQKKTLMS